MFADAHAHAEALDAVIAAADASGAEALWSLGDMVGAGPDPDHGAKPARIRVGEPLDLSGGSGCSTREQSERPSHPADRAWWEALDADATDGAFWLLLDLERHTASWHRAPYDPAPALERARALGL